MYVWEGALFLNTQALSFKQGDKLSAFYFYSPEFVSWSYELFMI